MHIDSGITPEKRRCIDQATFRGERISGSGGGGGGGGLFGPHNRNSLPFPDVPLPGGRNMQRVR